MTFSIFSNIAIFIALYMHLSCDLCCLLFNGLCDPLSDPYIVPYITHISIPTLFPYIKVAKYISPKGLEVAFCQWRIQTFLRPGQIKYFGDPYECMFE